MKVWLFHLAVLVVVGVLALALPPYHANNLARVLVLAVFATGYNLAFGYTGMLSLGHALFFAAGMYAAALPATLWGVGALPALILGLLAGGLAALAVGLLALRTAGVSFMIVTLMFAQAGYLTVIYFNQTTGGDQVLVLQGGAREVIVLDMAEYGPRVRVVFALYAGGLAGAAYAVLFGYAGASFAGVQYSILPMLYSLMGGAGTVLGPLVGAAAMFWLIDIASGLTTAWLMLVGVVLVGLVLFAPKGLLGWIRERWMPWLP